MKSIAAIAQNTFREAIRDRILYMFLTFAILLIAGSRFISMLTIGDSTKIIKDLGLFSIQMFGMLISVMMSVLMLSREFEHRTIYTIVTKPVSRLSYLLGKYFGLVAINALMVGLMTLSLLLYVLIINGQLDLLLLFGGLMTMMEMMVLSAFAVLFAVVTKPILGSVLTLCAFLVGHLTDAFRLFQDRLHSAVADNIMEVVYAILPNLEIFNFKSEIVHNLDIPLLKVVYALAYGLIYGSLVLFLAWIQFRNKDLD